MNVNRLPNPLKWWLDSRGFVWTDRHKDNPNRLNEDEIYSAACELLYDMNNGSVWDDEATPAEKATIKRFVEREGKTHKRLDLEEWYSKGD